MSSQCISCAVASGALTPEGGEILRTTHFNVSQDAEYMIPGFMIVASNRHFKCLDEMTADELHEWADVVARVRRSQRNALGIDEVYYFYNEDTRHHFHLWMIPRHEWMKDFGRSLESLPAVLKYAKDNFVTEQHLQNVRDSVVRLQSCLQ